MCKDEEKKNEQGKEPEMSKEEYACTVRSLRDTISSLTIAIFDCLERLEYLEIKRGMSSGFDLDRDFMLWIALLKRYIANMATMIMKSLTE